MKNGALKPGIRAVAMVLSVLFALQLLYNGAQLLLTADPDVVLLAEDALTPAQVHLASLDREGVKRDILERPLFWQTRRASEGSQESEAQRAQVVTAGRGLEDVTLLGIFGSGEGEAGGIIVRINNRQQRLGMNEQINGWKIVSVNGREVEFQQSGVTSTLSFEYGTD